MPRFQTLDEGLQREVMYWPEAKLIDFTLPYVGIMLVLGNSILCGQMLKKFASQMTGTQKWWMLLVIFEVAARVFLGFVFTWSSEEFSLIIKSDTNVRQ